eukprot:tig00000553_g2113.t1
MSAFAGTSIGRQLNAIYGGKRSMNIAAPKLPPSSIKPREPSPPSAPQRPAHLTAAEQIDYPIPGQFSRRPNYPSYWRPGKKPAAAIQAENPPDAPYVPGARSNKNFKDRTKEKERLQRIFENNGKDPHALLGAVQVPAEGEGEEEEAGEENEFDMLVREIDERKAFLDEMEQLGARPKYEAQIRGEIAQRLARMRQIERQRGARPAAQPPSG